MLKIYKKHTDFLNDYEQYFLDDEIRYSLILGITKRNKGITLMISSVIEDKFVVGVLAGLNLIIASNTLEINVYYDLVKYMENIDYPGIIGSKEYCDVYHLTYKEITGKELITKMDQRIYSCKEITESNEKVGQVRLATESDIDNLIEWAYNFAIDVKEPASMGNAKNHIEYGVKNKTLYVLEINNTVVSMAARSRPLIKTESVGFVYTPVEHRKNGYGRNVTTEVTKRVIEDGKIATLYTDLSNPTSNSIYMKIGYIPYCDSVMLNKS